MQSLAELLGVESRNSVYKKPIPIDTINKFWGIDSNIETNNEVVQKQALTQAEKNMWSFVDSNPLDMPERKKEDFQKSNDDYWGVTKDIQEQHPGN